MTKLDKDAVVAFVDAGSGFSGINEPGYYLFEGPVNTDKNGVVHESSMVPTKRVYHVGDGRYDTVAPVADNIDGDFVANGNTDVSEGGEG